MGGMNVDKANGNRETNWQDSKWKRAFRVLQKQRLVEEKKLPVEKVEGARWEDNTLLCLPVFVSKCIEAEISEEQNETFHSVLSKYFLQKFSRFYQRQSNSIWKEQKKVKLQFSHTDENFWAFMQRMADDTYSEIQSQSTLRISEEQESDFDSDLEAKSPITPSPNRKLTRGEKRQNSLRNSGSLRSSLDRKKSLRDLDGVDSDSDFDSVDLSELSAEEGLDKEDLKVKKMTNEEKGLAFKNMKFFVSKSDDEQGSDSEMDSQPQDKDQKMSF